MAKNTGSQTPTLENNDSSDELHAAQASGLIDPALEKSRARSNAARAAQEAAAVLVERRQLALVTNEARARAREQSIEQAKRQLKEDSKALRKLKSERPTLEQKLKDAKKQAEKTGRQARKLESKYDDAMLRHVVEREKSVDRALHTV